MKTKVFFFTALLFALLAVMTVYAHPGRTDSKGGHYVRAEGYGYPVGSYHYHRNGDTSIAYDANGNVLPRNDSTPAKAPANPTATPKPAPTAAPTPKPEPITVTVDGVPVEFDTPPQIINDRVMVQIRPIAVKLGCSVEWDDNTQTSYINQAGVPLQASVVISDFINVYVNNNPINFPDQKPVIADDYLLIPCRGVIEALGYKVEWDEGTRTQKITTK